MKISALGFTLIELLIVVAVIAIVSAAGYTYQASFRESQKLKIAANTILSLLGQAQSNATARRDCGSETGATWMVSFDPNQLNVNIKCQGSGSPVTQKSYTLEPNIVVGGWFYDINCFRVLPDANPAFSITFSPLYGTVIFEDTSKACITSIAFIKIQLKNTTTTESKDITVSEGGYISVEQ